MNVQNLYSNENLKAAISSMVAIDAKRLDNVEYHNCLSSIITNVA
jgi:hypothetical protein